MPHSKNGGDADDGGTSQRPRGDGRLSGSDLLASTGHSSHDADESVYSPTPPGYRKGYHKYVVVLGTVMSGLGKGIFASSMAKLVKDKGLTVAPSVLPDNETPCRMRRKRLRALWVTTPRSNRTIVRRGGSKRSRRSATSTCCSSPIHSTSLPDVS